MGMDVSGKRPRAPEGEYFRANVWGWRPIQDLCIKAGCSQAAEWSHNDGEGLQTQAECDVLAGQIEQYLRTHPSPEYVLPLPPGSNMGVDENGRFGAGNLSPYRVGVEHVRKFVTFLRACGGFEVW